MNGARVWKTYGQTGGTRRWGGMLNPERHQTNRTRGAGITVPRGGDPDDLGAKPFTLSPLSLRGIRAYLVSKPWERTCHLPVRRKRRSLLCQSSRRRVTLFLRVNKLSKRGRIYLCAMR